jgi:hypothetical protein
MTTPELPQSLEYLPDEIKALLKRTIKGRLRLLVTAKTTEKKRFEQLESATNISWETWRTWWRRDHSPSSQVIEAVGKAWPEHAFWLVTGITDVEAGHTMPTPPAIAKPYVDTFPETPFSAVCIYDFPKKRGLTVTWASTSEEPGGNTFGNEKFGKWPDGAYEFLEYTAIYLKRSIELQALYWKEDTTRLAEKTPEMKIIDSARIAARKERWKFQINKHEITNDDQAS